MEVKEMTIADVLKTPAFYNNLKVVISDLENTRRKAGMMADAPLKRHPIDRLQERGVFEPGQMTVLYANAMDKKLQGYSSSERKFILEVGGEAFNITMKQLVEQEKKDNESIKSKPVLQLKNGVIVKEYNSINEAAKINGFSPIAICKVCKGERKNHKGYMWRYKNEKA